MMHASFTTDVVRENFMDSITTSFPAVRAVLGLLKLGTKERLEVVVKYLSDRVGQPLAFVSISVY